MAFAAKLELLDHDLPRALHGLTRGGVTLKSRTATGPAPSGEPKRSRHCRVPCMALDAIAGGDHEVAASWLVSPNTTLDAQPIEKLQTVAGLVDVIAYLDARRALV